MCWGWSGLSLDTRYDVSGNYFIFAPSLIYFMLSVSRVLHVVYVLNVTFILPLTCTQRLLFAPCVANMLVIFSLEFLFLLFVAMFRHRVLPG